LLWVIPFGSIEVAPEYTAEISILSWKQTLEAKAKEKGLKRDARISGGPEQYQSISEWLEERSNPALQRLTQLLKQINRKKEISMSTLCTSNGRKWDAQC
jgi:hypothetical protein